MVLSLQTINSRWVSREIRKALQVQKRRQPEGYRVIPLLLPGVEPAALEHWFKKEPVAVPVRLTVAGAERGTTVDPGGLGRVLAGMMKTVHDVTAKPVKTCCWSCTIQKSEPGQENAGSRQWPHCSTSLPTLPCVESRVDVSPLLHPSVQLKRTNSAGIGELPVADWGIQGTCRAHRGPTAAMGAGLY